MMEFEGRVKRLCVVERNYLNTAVMEDFLMPYTPMGLDYEQIRHQCDHGLYGQDEIGRGVCNGTIRASEYGIEGAYPMWALEHNFIAFMQRVCIFWFVTVGCITSILAIILIRVRRR